MRSFKAWGLVTTESLVMPPQLLAGNEYTAEQRTAIKSALEAKNYNVMTYDDILKNFSRPLTVVTFGLGAFAGIALLAAMIGIVNTLLMAVFFFVVGLDTGERLLHTQVVS